MPQITKRKGVTSFLSQRMVNTFPTTSRAREYIYSNLKNLTHGISQSIYELGLNAERAWHNFFYQTLDPTELDVLYTVPKILDKYTITAYIDATSTVNLTKTEPALDEFYYEPLPTRFTYKNDSYRNIYPVKEASHLLFGNKLEQYKLGTHIEDNYISPTSSYLVSPVGDGVYSTSTSDGWGDGASQIFDLNNSTAISISFKSSSVENLEGKTISYVSQLKADKDNLLSTYIELGYEGVGSSVKTIYPSDKWQRLYLEYTPPTATSTGNPYIKYTFEKNNVSTNLIRISDSYMFNVNSINEESTAIPYSLRDIYKQDANWAYITVANGTNLFDVSNSNVRESQPASVTIQGINENGIEDTENMPILFNGTHQSSKLWKEITGTRVDAIYPLNAKVSIQLQNYQSVENYENGLDTLILPNHTGPLFYNLNVDNNHTFLEYATFQVSDLASMVGENHYIIPFFAKELADENGQPITLSDMKLDITNQWLYTLDAINKKIYIYDPLPPWPSKEKMALLKKRLPSPNLHIDELRIDELNAKIGDVIKLQAEWGLRTNALLKYRWIIHKPDNTKVGLKADGTEVPITSDYWILNDYGRDADTDEYAFISQVIDYTITQYDTYAAELEAVFYDKELQGSHSQTDIALFGAYKAIPKRFYNIDTSTLDVPIGLDIKPNGLFSIAYSTDNPFLIREENYTRHWDYYFEENLQKKIYLREKYIKVIIKLLEDVMAFSHLKNVVIVNNDTTLTIDDINNGYILLNTTVNNVTVTLPVVSASEQGIHCHFKRWGNNNAKILPNTGTKIDNEVDLSLVLDKDAENLTYIHDLLDWNRG